MTDPQRTYPAGVPCWVDYETPDPDAAIAFYGELFGWTFADAVPDGAPGSYLIASLEGRDAAAIAPGDGAAAPGWRMHVAVDDADAAARRVTELGGSVLSEPEDAGPGGRGASCADPSGAGFGLWQARARPGAQAINAPGAWNFNVLHAADRDAALAFYGALFGWESSDAFGPETLWRRPGYAQHLADTIDPGIFERHRAIGAPEGFEDAVAWLGAGGDAGAPRWETTFGVADRDAAADATTRLGGDVLATEDTPWTRTATVRDPQGAELTLSQFVPPDPGA